MHRGGERAEELGCGQAQQSLEKALAGPQAQEGFTYMGANREREVLI